MVYGNKMIVIAGANGAGKTTFFYQNKLVDDYIFVNADEIAKEVSLAKGDKDSNVRIIAGKEAINTVYAYLANNANFALETTLSGNFSIKVINKALNHGYEVELNYIGVNNPESSIKRVEHRVREGGHNVPTLDILRRYSRSIENMGKAVELVNVARIYDNSKQKHDLLLRLEKGILTNIYATRFPDWLGKTINVDELKIGHKLQKIGTQTKNININDYEKLWAESKPIKNSPVEKYLISLGLDGIEAKNIGFHPSVWEQETQSFMPAIVARAIGVNEANELQTQGVKICYVDQKTNDKAAISQPVKYIGSPDAIIMVQKAIQPEDTRWYLTPDIETALALKKVDPDIRIACLASCKNFSKNPLDGASQYSLIFCANKNISNELINKVADTFSKKQFDVFIAKPKQSTSFCELLNTQGKNSVHTELSKVVKIASAKPPEKTVIIELDDELEIGV